LFCLLHSAAHAQTQPPPDPSSRIHFQVAWDQRIPMRDQRETYTVLPNHVVWHSAPLPAETLLAGRPRLTLEVAVDQPDADLFASVAEVLPDGSAVELTYSRMRLRYRKGGVEAVPMVPGKPERVTLPPLKFFARTLAKGSRIRLIVDVGPHLGIQRNTHTGGDLVSEPLSRARIAKITLSTGPDSGAALELPRPDEGLLQRKYEPAKRP
jgi:predicted acyl esterase